MRGWGAEAEAGLESGPRPRHRLCRAAGPGGQIAPRAAAANRLGHHSTADIALDIAVAAACDHAVHVARPLARITDRRNLNERAPLLSPGLRAAGSPATAREVAGVTDLLWPLPDARPLASIIIPSRDRIDLIRPICHGVLQTTEYPALELIIVDNGSTDPPVLQFYEELRREPRTRILPFPHPFNFAAMVNAGVAAAAGGRGRGAAQQRHRRAGPGWLGELVRQAMRPEVGAVGAKLLFGDGTLQHAGVVIGLGGGRAISFDGNRPRRRGISAGCASPMRSRQSRPPAWPCRPTNTARSGGSMRRRSRSISTMSTSACASGRRGGRPSGRRPRRSRITSRSAVALGRGETRAVRGGGRAVRGTLGRGDPARSVLPSRLVAHDVRGGSGVSATGRDLHFPGGWHLPRRGGAERLGGPPRLKMASP